MEMANDAEAARAIAAINGTEVGGRTLNVTDFTGNLYDLKVAQNQSFKIPLASAFLQCKI